MILSFRTKLTQKDTAPPIGEDLSAASLERCGYGVCAVKKKGEADSNSASKTKLVPPRLELGIFRV